MYGEEDELVPVSSGEGLEHFKTLEGGQQFDWGSESGAACEEVDTKAVVVKV